MAASSIRRLVRLIWGDWQTNQLWQRIFKSSLACTIALIIAVIPQVVAIFGLNTYLIPMIAVFAHPGQRMAKMIESLALILTGALIGLAWSILGLYLSTLVVDYNFPAASSIRAIFMLVSTLAHGFIRSASPRLFVAVWLLLVASATTLMGRATEVSLAVFTSIIYPILAGTGVVLVVNLAIFPELSTSFLGSSTIETLSETMDTVSQATYWFVTPGGDSEAARRKRKQEEAAKKDKKKTWWKSFMEDFPNPFEISGRKKTSPLELSLTTLVDLADKKSALRESLLKCKAAQDEVNFEYSISPLPPKALKPISKHSMSSLVQNVITLIGACENKYVLLSTTAVEDVPILERSVPIELPKEGVFAPAIPKILQQVQEADDEDSQNLQNRIDEVKPLREIESGSVELLESILKSLRGPVQDFETAFNEAATLAMSCIAYCFDVPKLPSGARRPHGIEVEEIDLRIEIFTDALARFDQRSAEELRTAAMGEGKEVDLMPRMEMFLVSSFLLGFRQAALHVLAMLRHARELVDQRRKRHDRPTLWLPRYADFRQWLNTAGESDAMVLPEKARKQVRTGKTSKPAPSTDSADSSTSEDPLPWQEKDEEKALNRSKKKPKAGGDPSAKKEKRTLAEATWVMKLRGKSADALEWAQHSDDLVYALKLAVAVFCVSWPSFVTSWRTWYGDVRGIWAPLQLVLVFEVSIGTSLFIFFLRLFGVIFGCVVGYASYEIGRGNRIAMVVILVFGIVPSVYIQVATKYVKAGMISITTMCVVALAAMNQSGTAYENFYKRLVAFLVGSSVAIVVEVFIYPVRARHRLVESLSASVRQVQNMHSAISVGIDGPEKPNFRSHKLHSRFQRARDKAQASLAAAETFLPFCLNEPRLKGSFKVLEPIYKEIIYVLHQIIDRMDNVIDLRKAYGSSVLEDLNAHVYAYRRNVAAANTLILFSVHEALTTWLPLPQFIPSTRLAQLRLINRVREVLETKMAREGKDGVFTSGSGGIAHAASFVTQRKFLAWNANAAGHVEIIEYLEELVELTKLLVGVNAFRSGLLERPQYKDYVEQVKAERLAGADLAPSKSAPARPSEEQSTAMPAADTGASLRKVATMAASVQKFRQSLRNQREQQQTAPAEELTVHDSHADEDMLPQSLRRVGTRLQREGTVVRRRGHSTASRVLSRE